MSELGTQYTYSRLNSNRPGEVPDIYSESSTQLFPIGTEYKYGENTYRYAKAGAAIQAGLVVQAAAITEGDIAVQTAVTAGDKSIAVTTTATTAANQYDEGYLFVTQNNAQATRVGGSYRIKSHTSGSSGTLTFTLYDPIKVALDTSSKVTIIANRYNGVITAASTPTAELVGVTHPMQDANNTITDAYYFWLQTHGLAAIVATDVSDLTLIGQGVYYVSGGTTGNVTSLLGEAADGGTAITTTNQNLNIKIGTLVDAPGGADADAAVIRLDGFN
tara:strand:+ start:3889 stop:4713 length:825 start_codon:yes stop_codon:yes gene_type:complete